MPKDVRIFYVDQLEEGGRDGGMRVLDCVARADAGTAQRRDWIAALEAAVRSADPAAQHAALLQYETAQVCESSHVWKHGVCVTCGP